MGSKDLINFIYFILDEFIDNIDTNVYYDKYENMDKDSLYFYFKGKFDERMKGDIENEI